MQELKSCESTQSSVTISGGHPAARVCCASSVRQCAAVNGCYRRISASFLYLCRRVRCRRRSGVAPQRGQDSGCGFNRGAGRPAAAAGAADRQPRRTPHCQLVWTVISQSPHSCYATESVWSSSVLTARPATREAAHDGMCANERIYIIVRWQQIPIEQGTPPLCPLGCLQSSCCRFQGRSCHHMYPILAAKSKEGRATS